MSRSASDHASPEGRANRRDVLRAGALLAGAATIPAGVLNVLLYGDVIRHVLPARAAAPAADALTHARLVVLGFDGVDHRWLGRYLDEDQARATGDRRLGNLARLRTEGTLLPLRSEIPPESPVAWASVQTGVNPARHGVFDFVLPGSDYRPGPGMVELKRMRLALGRIVIRPPHVKSRLAAPTFLERIQEAGYDVLGIREPLAFPVTPLPGAHILAGLGTPDIAGGAGFYAVWSSRVAFPSGDTVFGGVQIPLDPDAPGTWRTFLPGPVDPTLPRGAHDRFERRSAPLRFTVAKGREKPGVTIELAGRTVFVPVGERSPFLVVPFRLGTIPTITLRGHVRFEVKRIDPVEILADPVNIYAPDAPLPLSTPKEWAGELFERYGPFETVGWTEQTFALNDGYQDDEGFLRDLLDDMDRGAGLLLGEIDRGSRCVFQVFTATDRGLHCFYRYYDPESPGYVAGRVEALGDPMLLLFERMDRIIGDVLGRLGRDDVLLVCSDHGFQTWRWQVNLNQWLVQQGYMKLLEPVVEQNLAIFNQGGDVGADAVDWKSSRAYAMGLGQIYLNLEGREDQGIVRPRDAEALVKEIREKLLQLRNPYLPDDKPVLAVYPLREVYHGPFLHRAAEIQVGFGPAYRVSWQTALLGGMGRPVFEKNTRPWSGDHCSNDVSTVPGIFLVNRRLPPDAVPQDLNVRDVAATAQAFFGVDTSDLEGRPVRLSSST